jgi:hypothetical protein
MTRIAQPAVVTALERSDCRDLQRRYRPTTARVMLPKTVKTFE